MDDGYRDMRGGNADNFVADLVGEADGGYCRGAICRDCVFDGLRKYE